MKHKFKVGDKVICLDSDKTVDLKPGTSYVISRVDNNGFIAFNDLGQKGTATYFNTESYRFELAPPNKIATLRTSTNGFRFNLVAANNEKIATSEVYSTKSMAMKTIKKYFPDFEIIDKTKSK